MIRRGRLAIGAALLIVGAASCATQQRAERTYLTLRDQYRRSLTIREQHHEDVAAADDSAIADLEARLRRIVGDFNAPYVAGNGRSNLDTVLPGDMGSGVADGMLYNSRDSTTHVLVTTPGLLEPWVTPASAKKSSLPRDLREALSDAGVLNQVFDVDAAVQKFTDIPARGVEPGDVVAATLVTRAQDYCRCQPDELFVSVVRGPRVFIIDTPVRDTLPVPRVCDAQADSAAAKSKVMYDRALRATPSDTVLLKAGSANDSVADVEFRRCYADHIVHDARFGNVIAQVRELIAGLPRR